ncbi:MAG TPA: CPBP family intramembrane glutamic endopeptidase [Mucilaginibacter sp.]
MKEKMTQRPVLYYFILTFAISWLGAYLTVSGKLIHGLNLIKPDGLRMYPVLLLGPPLSGVAMTALLYGTAGLKRLFSGLCLGRVARKWYFFFLAIPPIMINVVLFALNQLFSGQFVVNNFIVGFLFGIPAGLLEEIGWTGYLFPQLRKKAGLFPSALLLGLIWGAWHYPVIYFLGSASPHGPMLLPFFGVFILVMAAIRIFICYIYEKTRSLLLAQLFHISSTGSLVVFGPLNLSPEAETTWYLLYADALWLLIAFFLINAFIRHEVA